MFARPARRQSSRTLARPSPTSAQLKRELARAKARNHLLETALTLTLARPAAGPVRRTRRAAAPMRMRR